MTELILLGCGADYTYCAVTPPSLPPRYNNVMTSPPGAWQLLPTGPPSREPKNRGDDDDPQDGMYDQLEDGRAEDDYHGDENVDQHGLL
jgi:hypothetical protein